MRVLVTGAYGLIGSAVLAHLEAAARRAGWECPQLLADGPSGFYAARSSWAYSNLTAE